MRRATLERPTDPSLAPTAAETMEAIVQDAYGSDPEAVLRIAEVAKPTVSGDEVVLMIDAERPAGTGSGPGRWRRAARQA